MQQNPDVITAAMNAIGAEIVKLLSDSEWGTKDNPSPLRYTKRRAGAYPVLYFGPKSEKRRIPQDLLQQNKRDQIKKLLSDSEKKEWEDRKPSHEIIRYIPTRKSAVAGGRA